MLKQNTNRRKKAKYNKITINSKTSSNENKARVKESVPGKIGIQQRKDLSTQAQSLHSHRSMEVLSIPSSLMW